MITHPFPLPQGRVRLVKEDSERGPLREAFLKKYPDAFWVDFGDFRWCGALQNVAAGG